MPEEQFSMDVDFGSDKKPVAFILDGVTQRIIVAEGGLWEFSEWEIELNCKVGNSRQHCRHCRHDGNEWICPRVVIQLNEGGFSSTGVCMDCIIETSEALKRQDDIRSTGIIKLPM